MAVLHSSWTVDAGIRCSNLSSRAYRRVCGHGHGHAFSRVHMHVQGSEHVGRHVPTSAGDVCRHGPGVAMSMGMSMDVRVGMRAHICIGVCTHKAWESSRQPGLGQPSKTIVASQALASQAKSSKQAKPWPAKQRVLSKPSLGQPSKEF